MMPSGFCGVPSTFMTLMSEVKNGLANVFACLDNAIIIYSESEEDHGEHLQAFFQSLSDYRLPLNSKKCIFGTKKLDFLRNSIT